MTTEVTPAQREVLDFVRAFTRDELAAERACMTEPDNDTWRALEAKAAVHLHVTPSNIQSLAFGRHAPPGGKSELLPALVEAGSRLKERRIFTITQHEREGATVFCVYVGETRQSAMYAEILNVARVEGALKILGRRACNPFKREKVAWESAGGDQFKGLAKPIAVIKLERPDFPQHAAHQDALAPGKKR